MIKLLNLISGRSVSNQVRNGSSYSSSIKPVTMNEMPVPSGSWSEHYNAKQKAYNMHLMIGLALAAVSVVAVSFFSFKLIGLLR